MSIESLNNTTIDNGVCDPQSSDPAAPGATPPPKRKPRAKVGEYTQQELRLIQMVSALVSLKDKPALPPELDLTKLQAHVTMVQTTRKADQAALIERKKGLQLFATAQAEARTMVRRALLWLDGVLPANRVGRIDFLAAGPGGHSLQVQLTAFVSGLSKHPDVAKHLPPTLTAKALLKCRDDLDAAEKLHNSAILQKEGASVPKTVNQVSTQELVGQLTSFVRGWFGLDSVELVQFGLKPRVVRK